MSSLKRSIKLYIIGAKRIYESKGAFPLILAIIKTFPKLIIDLTKDVILDITGTHSYQEERYRSGWSKEKLQVFTEHEKASELLLSLIKAHSGCEMFESLKVLEIGCGPGRRVNFLHQNGIEDIYGIDINPDAIELMDEVFPELASDIVTEVGSAQEILENFEDGSFDVVYTIGVLMHIRSAEEKLFDQMARVTNNLLITMEAEDTEHGWEQAGISEIHLGERNEKNYKEEFEGRGFSQIEALHAWEDNPKSEKLSGLTRFGDPGAHSCRCFKKNDPTKI